MQRVVTGRKGVVHDFCAKVQSYPQPCPLRGGEPVRPWRRYPQRVTAESGDARIPTLGLGQLVLRFLRFGGLAWGGPIAQIAMLRRELVDDERWIRSERFNRTLAVYQVLPGPEAQELSHLLRHAGAGAVSGASWPASASCSRDSC